MRAFVVVVVVVLFFSLVLFQQCVIQQGEHSVILLGQPFGFSPLEIYENEIR